MPRNMGLGKLAKPELVFVRKFRYILKGKYLDESFQKAVSINYTTKTLSFSTYEIVEGDEGRIQIHEWADAVESGKYADEELILTTYDGCGYELYSRKLTGLKITDRNNDFDYSNSDAAVHQVTLKYENCEMLPVTDRRHPTQPKETQIDHLNSRMWIDGETKKKEEE